MYYMLGIRQFFEKIAFPCPKIDRFFDKEAEGERPFDKGVGVYIHG